LSQDTLRPICPFCRSTDVTLNPIARVFTCNSCGGKYPFLTYPTQQATSSASNPVAGTVEHALVKTEEFEYRRTTQQMFPHSHEEFQKLGDDIEQVKATVEKLDEKVEELRASLPKVVVLEEISKEEGKKRVEEYFKEHGQADIEELMLNLKIPVQTLVEIIDDLKKEGRVAPKVDKES
jgi:transposase-like protein